MTKKIIFFTASAVATPQEITAMNAIKADEFVKPAYELVVRNGSVPNTYGHGVEGADYVAGAVPSAYSAKPVFDPADLPETP